MLCHMALNNMVGCEEYSLPEARNALFIGTCLSGQLMCPDPFQV